MPSKHAVIFVHGVGPAKEGEMIQSFLEGQKNGWFTVETGTFATKNETYPYGRLDDGTLLTESNWSNLRGVRSSKVAIFFEMLVLLWGMLILTQYKSFAVGDEARSTSSLGWWYRKFFLIGLFWCINPSFIFLFYFTEDYTAMFVWFAAWFFAIWSLSKYDRIFQFGYAWLAAAAIGCFCFSIRLVSLELLVGIATLTYVLTQMTTISIGWMHMFTSFIERPKVTFEARAIRLGFVFIPFFAAGGIGSLVWTAALARTAYVSNSNEGQTENFNIWANTYEAWSIYPVFAGEMYNGLSMMLVGCLLIFPALLTFFNRKLRRYKTTAQRTRRTFASSLHYAGCLVLVLIPLFPIAMAFAGAPNASSGQDIFTAYLLWSSRIWPFLTLFFGGFAIGLKILGDVVFYLVPPTDQISAHTSAREKLEKLTKHLLDTKHAVLIISHSQGTMVGLDAVRNILADRTQDTKLGIWICGSPSCTLYNDFLQINRLVELHPKVLMNYYRFDDVIGGSISSALPQKSNQTDDEPNPQFPEEKWDEGGGHTNYWKDFDLQDVKKALTKIEMQNA
jgi:hypothetical protein